MSKVLVARIVLVFAALSACGESHGPPAILLTIRGTVSDAVSVAPIATARVELQTIGCLFTECPPLTLAEANADRAGHYELREQVYCTENAQTDAVWLFASAPGYHPQTVWPLLCSAQTQTIDVGLQPQP